MYIHDKLFVYNSDSGVYGGAEAMRCRQTAGGNGNDATAV